MGCICSKPLSIISNATPFVLKVTIQTDEEKIVQLRESLKVSPTHKKDIVIMGGDVDNEKDILKDINTASIEASFKGFSMISPNTFLNLTNLVERSSVNYLTLIIDLGENVEKNRNLLIKENTRYVGAIRLLVGLRDGYKPPSPVLPFIECTELSLEPSNWRSIGGTQNYYLNHKCPFCDEKKVCLAECDLVAKYGGQKEKAKNIYRCTFSQKGSYLVEQQEYYCKTCQKNNICEDCAKVCHKGHDIVFYRNSSFRCDCFFNEKNKCQLCKNT